MDYENDPGVMLGCVNLTMPQTLRHLNMLNRHQAGTDILARLSLPGSSDGKLTVKKSRSGMFITGISVDVGGLPTGNVDLVHYQYQRLADGLFVSRWVQGNGHLADFPSSTSAYLREITGTVTVYRPPAEAPTAFYLKHGRGCESPTRVDYSAQDSAILPNPPYLSLLRDVPALCDVVLRAAGGDFPVHRNVLAARSPVFLTMFTGDFKEAKDKSVELSVNCTADVFAAFVDFLYTGALGERDCGEALQLLELGERYLVDDLKRQCVRRLLAVAGAAEAVEVLHAALEKPFVPSEVRIRAVAVIKKHWPAVSTTDAWKQLFDAHPASAVSLEAAFADVNVGV